MLPTGGLYHNVACESFCTIKFPIVSLKCYNLLVLNGAPLGHVFHNFIVVVSWDCHRIPSIPGRYYEGHSSSRRRFLSTARTPMVVSTLRPSHPSLSRIEFPFGAQRFYPNYLFDFFQPQRVRSVSRAASNHHTTTTVATLATFESKPFQKPSAGVSYHHFDHFRPFEVVSSPPFFHVSSLRTPLIG